MSGKDLFNNLVDELNRARDLLYDNNISADGTGLVADIDTDLDRVSEHRDSIDALLEDLDINEGIER